MEVLLAILPIVSALVTFLLSELVKAQSVAADPKTQNATRYEQIDNDIQGKNSTSATLHSTADLDEFERLRRNKAGSNPG